MLNKVRDVGRPVILVINKVDRIKDKKVLFSHLEILSQKADFKAIVPLSAQHGHNLNQLEGEVAALMPRSLHFFPEDQITDPQFTFPCRRTGTGKSDAPAWR